MSESLKTRTQRVKDRVKRTTPKDTAMLATLDLLLEVADELERMQSPVNTSELEIMGDLASEDEDDEIDPDE